LVQNTERENTGCEEVNCDAVSQILQLDCTEEDQVEDQVNKDKTPVATEPQALCASHFYSSRSSKQQTLPVSSVIDANFPFNNSSFPSDVDSDILPYPQRHQDRPLKKENKEHYFVLTANEVYASKLAAAEDKIKKQLQTEARKKAWEEKDAAAKARKDKDKAPAAECKKLVDVQPQRQQTKRRRKTVEASMPRPTCEQKRPKRTLKKTSRLSL